MKFSDLNPESQRIVQAYRQDILRWNRQINLVSRQDTGDRLDLLLAQSGLGLSAARDVLGEHGCEGPLWYFDLGSGGGVPGVVWHTLLAEHELDLRSWMVEPREKRAWFLERQGQHFDLDRYSVACGRWGDVFDGPDGESPSRVLISLKALRLTDEEVLSGLGTFLGARLNQVAGSVVLIARYYPEGQAYDGALVESIGLQKAERDLLGEAINAEPCGGRVVPFGNEKGVGASLVFSGYRLS